MKKIIRYSLLVLLLITLGSCQGYLNYNEEDFYTKEDVFSDYGRTSSTLGFLYSNLPSGLTDIGGSMRESATDDAEEANELELIQVMNDGRWSALRTVDNYWGTMYTGIRSANQLLANFDLASLLPWRYNDDYANVRREYTLYDEQARFLRAYFYFELIRRYGDVPLLHGKILDLNDVNNVMPNSYDEVKNYIIDECNAIVDSLPVNWKSFSGDQNGRITRGTVMALKARTLLYAASPLHNSANSLEKWKEAAKASYAIIDSAKTKGWYNLDANYKDVVNNSKSTELILGKRLGASNYFEASNLPVGFQGAQPGTCPTQNLVNAYEMKNGMHIDAPNSGYDPNNPYANRDPRLNLTIIVNNSMWKGRNVQIWFNGQDGKPIAFATKTGYYLKKYLVETVSLDPNKPTTATHLNVIFRYAEVLLNYAEAMNEAYGPDNAGEFGMTALAAVNMIRTRAQMPSFQTGMTKEEFRQELRRERRIELAFENHRFWDIRRWNIGDTTSEIKGMNITRNDNGTFNYNEVTVETRVWDSKMNLYPIPQAELFKNSNLKQNIGW